MELERSRSTLLPLALGGCPSVHDVNDEVDDDAELVEWPEHRQGGRTTSPKSTRKGASSVCCLCVFVYIERGRSWVPTRACWRFLERRGSDKTTIIFRYHLLVDRCAGTQNGSESDRFCDARLHCPRLRGVHLPHELDDEHSDVQAGCG